MFITEQNGQNKWQKILKEELGAPAEKLNWMSQYAQVHEIHESMIGVNAQGGTPAAAPVGVGGVGPVYSTPLNTLGMGNPSAPGQLDPHGHDAFAGGAFRNQAPGSGDIPVSTLAMALNVALTTIGLELVPVVPSKGPWAMLSYMDFPYAGGKMGLTNETAFDGKGAGKENKPYYIRVCGDLSDAAVAKLRSLDGATKLLLLGRTGETVNGVVEGLYRGFSRMDGQLIVEVCSCKTSTADDAENISLRKAVAGNVTICDQDGVAITDATGAEVVIESARPDFVETSSDFMDGFANFADGGDHPMTRAENETGTGNTLGLRLFSKWIQMGSYEVTGTVTRQQLQDLPLYGVDAMGKIMEAMQNELTQSINARILEKVFALGVTNARSQYRQHGIDLNLFMGSTLASKELNPGKDVYGQPWAHSVDNSEVMTSAENLHTRQRRISSRIMAASNLIQVTGRRGRATWVVTNAQVATALQDVSSYVVAPMANTMTQGADNLYLAGTLAGLKVYVDPYMAWDDTRICVGRKGDANSPGVIFMPYILADTVTITAEGTMAPKALVNSRFAIAEAGFYPELMYYTFCVDAEAGII